MSDDSPLLEVRNLEIGFGSGRDSPVPAVRGISFEVPANATVALVGESGSGKSVTALSILGLLPANAVVGPASSIRYAGRELIGLPRGEFQDLRGSAISMVFQEPMTSLNPVFTAGYQLCEVLRAHLGLERAAARARAIELLAEVGIPEPASRIDAFPFQLSGGQQQRVMIAMAIACEPKLLVADEPTTALDVTVQKQILGLLAELQKRHRMSVLFITHDLAVVGEIADRVIVMKAGEIREQGQADQVFESPRDPYTRALLACRPPLDHRPMRLPVIADFLEGVGSYADAGGERLRGFGSSGDTVLEARHVSKSFFLREGLFAKREVKAVRDVSFALPRGKTLGLVGESGSGKSTLAMVLMRLHDATSGQVLLDGVDWFSLPKSASRAARRRIQIVFQNPYASLNPRFTAGQILTEPMRIHGIGAGEGERKSQALGLLDRVGLTQAAYFKYPHEFSGGQRQRIAIARCLTLKPEVLICDESVSALDVSIQAQLLNLLQELQDEYGMSYLFISHDLGVVRYMADRVMVMKDGAIVESGESDAIYSAPREPYTRQLLDAMPRGWQGRAA